LGDRRGIASTHRALALIAYFKGDYAYARPLYEETLAIHRELGDKPGIAQTELSLGDVLRCQGEHRAAGEHYRESLALYRELADDWAIGGLLGNLGYVLLHQGDYRSAATYLTEGLSLFRRLYNELASQKSCAPGAVGSIIRGGAILLGGLAAAFGAAGQLDQAARWIGVADALREAVQARMWPADQADYERHVAAVRAALGDTAYTAAWSQGRALPLEEAVPTALREAAQLMDE
jgi:tetratricopeptide (TPR) repeat protein